MYISLRVLRLSGNFKLQLNYYEHILQDDTSLDKQSIETCVIFAILLQLQIASHWSYTIECTLWNFKPILI